MTAGRATPQRIGRRGAALLWLVALAACAASPSPPALPGDPAIASYARTVLNDLQTRSIAESREYCGYIYRQPGSGRLAHTLSPAGAVDFCDYGFAPTTTVASFHTHGNHSVDYDSEVPSVDDLAGSVEIGYDDYLATPGGRFWLVGADGVARLICGPGCLISDPAYRPDPTLPVRAEYTLAALASL